MAPKGKKSKKADDNWDEGLGEPADGVVDSPAGDVEEAQDEDVGGGLMATLRKNKEKRKKKGKADDEQEDLADKAPVEASMDDEFAETGKIKTKAEKEKEKKEREKARKKEQAAAKKKTPAAPPPKVEEKVVEVVEVKPEPAGGKKKKLNPALAALQKQQEELRRRQEEDAKSVAEEQARIAREEKEAEEEEKRKAEQKAAKKEREKQKVLELKKQGLYKTDKQKKDEAQAKLRLQQMLESGTAKVAGIDGDDTTRKPKERKRNPRKEAEERKAREEAEAERRALELRQKEEQKVEPVVEEPKEESEDELDDWEAMAEKEESVAVPIKATATPTKEESKEEDSEDDEEDDSDEDSSSEDEKETATQRQVRERKEQAHAKRQQQIEDARNAGSKDNLRSPIAVILGHVDTGKTSLLDRVRQTSVQAGEAGGITQQIGATYFPADALRTKTQVVNKDGGFAFKIPGLLIIDTPGHESFSNLRSRGSSLCNIAILVVDLFHGLEPQTLESMKLLRDRKTPFIVALNKVDRCYGWKAIKDNGFQDSLAQQNNAVQSEFHDRVEKTKLLFAEEGFNAELYYKNKNLSRYVSLVPTSAITGEGVPDLLKLLIMLTQERMAGQLMYLSEVEATVLEVKPIDGLGTTIDVILSNGYLREGDTAVLCGTEGPIVFQIRALLTPGEMKELRVKGSYVHHKEVKAALGVKITGPGLDNAIAGSRLLIAKDPDDEDEIEELCDDVMEDLEGLMGKISRTGRGVTVAASTLGSLEALLSFLSAMKIPVGNISIGTVHKRDVVTASTMLEKASEYAMMLCFDVKIERDAQELADSLGIKVFSAPIIYHLFDRFREHQAAILAKKKEEAKLLAVWPCVLTQLAVFNKIDPIVIGVDVAEGTLKVGCPIAAVKVNPTTKAKEVISLGRVTSIERDHKQIPSCKKNQPSVAVKIEGPNQPTYGRQVDESMTLYSLISRKTIDTLKEFHRDETTKEEWTLIAKHLKPLFDIQ